MELLLGVLIGVPIGILWNRVLEELYHDGR